MTASQKRFESLLDQACHMLASDVHLSPGRPVYWRQHGKLLNIPTPTWEQEELEHLISEILQPKQLRIFHAEHSLDFAYTTQRGVRFRLNLYHERQRPSLAIRRIDESIASFESLHLPPSLTKLTEIHDGLILITGPTGSGKSTTLNAIIDLANARNPQHIITIEDPIEQIHEENQCLIHQRELFTDVLSYEQGVKDALREDPDIILVGEMRDPETMRTVIAAAETGHTVFSTLHTSDAVGAINRILGGFTAAEQTAIRHQLSMVLRAVVSQRLVLNRAEDNRIPIVEVLWGTKAVCNHIRTGRLEQIYTLMESGAQHGMMTREQSLAYHVTRDGITLDEALKWAKDPKVLVDLLRYQSTQPNECPASDADPSLDPKNASSSSPAQTAA